MHRQLNTWQFIIDNMQQQVAVMLLYVVHSHGSSPGRRGFMMAVNIDGKVEGSIGGGIMEHKFIELAKARLSDGVAESSLHPQVHNKEAKTNQSGMICSGEQTVIILTISLNDKPAIEKIIDTLLKNGYGYLEISPAGIAFKQHLQEQPEGLSADDAPHWKYLEKILPANQLIIVGGGHCALALSRLMQTLNFHITLYEERNDLHTVVKNEFVDEKVFLEDYAFLEKVITGGNNCYIIIMTVGYRTDDIVIRALRQKRFRYFGVLGSQKKIEKMMEEYRSEGWDEKWLSLISAPAGLQIESQTPEEIAVSIAAEIVKVKNQRSSY